MSILYQFIVTLSQGILPIAALFSSKIKKFHSGRKEVFKQLKKELDPRKKTLWLHAASLGEYEQGVPVLEALRLAYPKHQILVSFFSPSGYEIRKNSTLADCVCYLPIDSFKNARRFIRQINPSLALFVKYEVWPNFMLALQEAAVPSILFSGIFRPSQIYFKWYGGLMRESLQGFSKILVQDSDSIKALAGIGISNTALTGDTRFDRVHSLSLRPNALPTNLETLIQNFIGQTPCMVAGSVWPEDLEVLAPALAQHPQSLKIILAPHKVGPSHIASLVGLLPETLIETSCLLSKASVNHISKANILIVDQIGILNSLYPLAQMAFIGGGFKTGLHNTLEAAVYGIPLAIGPDFNRFKEAVELVQLGGAYVVNNSTDAAQFLERASERNYQKEVHDIQKKYLASQLGSTQKIMREIKHMITE